MKANELRIGNLINYEQTTHVISSISENHVISYWVMKKREETWHDFLDDIKPIPLTEEWLEKSGKFDWSDDYWILLIANLTEIELLYQGDEFKVYMNDLPIQYIKYVHQLQNLYFALTGTELELI